MHPEHIRRTPTSLRFAQHTRASTTGATTRQVRADPFGYIKSTLLFVLVVLALILIIFRTNQYTFLSNMGSNTSRGVSANAEKIVQDAIDTYPVLIFSKSYCPYCRAAKGAIARAGQAVAGFEGPKVFELDLMSEGSAIQQYLASLTGRTTVPNVFIGGVSVGGGDDTVKYERSGVLKQMLTQASEQLRAKNAAEPKTETEPVNERGLARAVFGAGCFWGVELAFQRQQGVEKTQVGYSNGNTQRTTYEAVCTGATGHAEVVSVWYDPKKVSYERLLNLWESRHDVTSKDKQGNDRGTQYRSAIFYTNKYQEEAALKWMQSARSRYNRNVVTVIEPLKNYAAAESYHQKYLEKKGQSAAKGAAEAIRCYG